MGISYLIDTHILLWWLFRWTRMDADGVKGVLLMVIAIYLSLFVLILKGDRHY